MNQRTNFFDSIPPVTRHLLILNVLMWVATIAFEKFARIDLTDILGLHYWAGSKFNPVQFVTYMFMHDPSGPMHLFFNMFSLWMFGRIIERALGMKRYLLYYITCGLGAALVQELVWQFTWQSEFVGLMALSNSTSTQVIEQALRSGQITEFADQFCNQLVTVGASGAVFGLLLAFGLMFPNMPLYIIPFPFPIKAKWMVLGYGVIELVFGMTGSMSSVAHYAHLGGMLFGLLLLLYWRRTNQWGGYGNY